MHYYINSYAKVLETSCKSQAKSHQALYHQLSPNYQVPWALKREAEESTTSFSSCKKIVIMPKRWPASQATEGWKRTEQWKSQQIASCKKVKIFPVSNILMPSDNKFNRVFPFLLYLVSWTPHNETVCSVRIPYKPSSLCFTAFAQYRNKRN